MIIDTYQLIVTLLFIFIGYTIFLVSILCFFFSRNSERVKLPFREKKGMQSAIKDTFYRQYRTNMDHENYRDANAKALKNKLRTVSDFVYCEFPPAKKPKQRANPNRKTAKTKAEVIGFSTD